MISEKREERAAELRETYGVTVTGNAEAVADADVVLLVVKPQDVLALLDEIAGSVRPEATVVSLAAGITIGTIEAALPGGVAVIRAMPNTPALVGEGMFGISPGSLRHAASRSTTSCALLESGGKVVVVDEAQQDAVTAVSGSGPAYVFYLAEAMIAGGIDAGLDEADGPYAHGPDPGRRGEAAGGVRRDGRGAPAPGHVAQRHDACRDHDVRRPRRQGCADRRRRRGRRQIRRARPARHRLVRMTVTA